MATAEVSQQYVIYSVAKLRTFWQAPTWVKPDQPVTQAVTLMMQNDFSQLPVMTSEREVKGLISWKSLCSHMALCANCSTIRDCMESTVEEVTLDASLFSAISKIIEHECVLVRDSTRRVCGIVTTSDIATRFRELSEPFLLLGEIENHLRALVQNRFSIEELQAARDPKDSVRPITSPHDLTFGEYVRLLADPENWARLSISVERTEVIRNLEAVRDIRNDVMHFCPDPIDVKELDVLRKSASFLSRLRQITNKNDSVS